jgi:hypothetical protein
MTELQCASVRRMEMATGKQIGAESGPAPYARTLQSRAAATSRSFRACGAAYARRPSVANLPAVQQAKQPGVDLFGPDGGLQKGQERKSFIMERGNANSAREKWKWDLKGVVGEMDKYLVGQCPTLRVWATEVHLWLQSSRCQHASRALASTIMVRHSHLRRSQLSWCSSGERAQ